LIFCCPSAKHGLSRAGEETREKTQNSNGNGQRRACCCDGLHVLFCFVNAAVLNVVHGKVKNFCKGSREMSKV